MGVPLHELRQLTWLAQQHTDQSRQALLERITDVFMDAPDSYTEPQNECFGDIMTKLAFTLEREVREELACKIADEVNAPRLLVLRLANDVVSVALPLLERSPALSEIDLIQVVKQRSQDHLLAITRRSDIRVRLSAVLADLGNDRVVESLLQNEGADIASDTLQRVVDRAKGSNILQTALIERHDVPKTIMLDLIDHVSDKLRDHLMHRLTETDKANLDDVIHAFRAQANTAESSPIEQEIDDLAASGKLSQFVLLRFITRGKYQHFLLGLSRLTKIGVPAVMTVLGDESGTALAIICRANDFDVKTLKNIAMSPLTNIPADLAQVRELVWAYERLSRENAREAIKYWRTRKTSGIPELSKNRREPILAVG